MNNIYRLIWSWAKEKWVVVSEKTSGKGSFFTRTCGAFCLAALLMSSNPAWALDSGTLPTGGQITAGSGSITQSGSQMDINQKTDKLTANWSTFNIGADAGVTFRQPGASSVALNRILDQNPSQILGSLSANGQVFLINSAGIIFGTSATVNVGGLVASSLQISDEDFLNGNYAFSNSGAAGSIVNNGVIRTADGGYVAFLSPAVTNTGAITAPDGRVALAAGDKVNLDFSGDGLLSFTVEQGAIDAQAANDGLIRAGGAVYLSAKAAQDLQNAVVNNTGIIEATGITTRGGSIILDADGGQTTVSGTLDVSSESGAGGSITATGDIVLIESGANLDASGATGGGEVFAGGGWQGSNPDIRNSATTYIEQGAVLKADATATGDGGTVVVWSDGQTVFNGSISARGGQTSGDGGNVEVSGKEHLGFYGAVDTQAVNGGNGTILLDPNNITIVDGSSGQTGSYADWCTHGTYTDYVIPETILEALTGDVILTALNNIVIEDLSDNELTLSAASISFLANDESSGSSAGGFTMDTSDTINLMGTGDLTLQGGSQAGPSSTYSIYAGNLVTNGGDVIFNTKRSSAAMPISVAGSITTNGGSVTVAPGTRFGLTNSDVVDVRFDGLISTSGGSFTSNMTGTVLINGGLNLGFGSATFGGTGTQINSVITSTADVTVSSPLTFGAGSGITTTGAITFTQTAAMASANADLTLTAGNFVFNDTFTGNSASITLRPASTSDGMAIGADMIAAFAHLSGFSSVICGRSDGTGALTFDAATSVSNPTTFIMGGAGGTVTIGNTVSATGTASLTFNAGGSLNINSDISTVSGGISLLGNTVTVASSKTVSSTAGGAMTVAANTLDLGGSLSSTGSLTIRPYSSSAITVSSSAGSGLLLDPSLFTTAAGKLNNFGSLVLGDTTYTGGIAFNEATTMETGASGGLTLMSATGDITQSGALSVTGTTSITAGGNNIILDNEANSFTGKVSIVSGNNVSLLNTDALDLGASTISGNLTLQTSGAITQSGALTVIGATAITTGGNNITLADSSNDFTGTLGIASGNNVELYDADTLILGAVNVEGTVDIATGTGNLTLTGAISTTDASTSAVILNAGETTDAGTSTGGNIIVSGGSISTGEGGRATLYSGSMSGSTGMTVLIGSGSGKFRYNSDETATNYTTALGAGTYAVYREQPLISVTPSSESITYAEAAPGFTYTLSGLINGDTSAGDSGTAAYSIGGATSTSGNYTAGSHDISYLGGLTSSLGYGFKDQTTSTRELTINKLTLSVTGISAASSTYGSALSPGDVSLSGVIGGDTVTASATVNTGATSTSGNYAAGVYTQSPDAVSGDDAANYSLPDFTTATANYTINKLAVTLTYTAQDKIYDATTTANVSCSLTGLLSADVLNTSQTAVYENENVGTGKAISITNIAVSGADAGNYSIQNTTATASADITPAQLTVTANDAFVTYLGLAYYGGNGVSISGFAGNDGTACLTGELIYTGTSQGAIDPGIYVITPSGFSSQNYDIGYVDGTLIIGQIPVDAGSTCLQTGHRKIAQKDTITVLSPSAGSHTLAGHASLRLVSKPVSRQTMTTLSSAKNIAPVRFVEKADSVSLTIGPGAQHTQAGVETGEVPIFTQEGSSQPRLQGAYVLRESESQLTLTSTGSAAATQPQIPETAEASSIPFSMNPAEGGSINLSAALNADGTLAITLPADGVNIDSRQIVLMALQTLRQEVQTPLTKVKSAVLIKKSSGSHMDI